MEFPIEQTSSMEIEPVPDTEVSSSNNVVDNRFVETVERILIAEENRAAPDEHLRVAASKDGSGPLTIDEISELSMLCTMTSSRSSSKKRKAGFASVELDSLVALLLLLEKHVNIAVGIDLIQEACTFMNDFGGEANVRIRLDSWLLGVGGERISSLRQGLTAASVLLFIMTSPGIEKRVVSEDVIEASITLLRHNLNKNIIPCLNNTGHIGKSSSGSNDAEHAAPSRKRRRIGAGGSSLMRELKKLYKHIEASIGLHLLLMERIELLIHTIPLEDQQVMTLTSGTLNALEIDASSTVPGRGTSRAHLLQLITIDVITAAFRKYPMHRITIVEDLFPIMLKLPCSKKSLRTFPIRYTTCPCPGGTQLTITSLFASTLPNAQPPHSIQVMTSLILSMVQSCVIRPTYESSTEANNGMPDGNQHDTTLVSGLRDCHSICDAFVKQMLQRCARKGEDGGASEFRPVLSNLIEDLLLVLLIPEYAASEMLLFAFSKRLCRDIMKASTAFKNYRSSKTTESTYLNTAFDALGRICSVQAKIMAASREKPLELISNVMIPNENDKKQKVSCYCNRNDLENVLMLDCDRCHTWFHAHCVGLTRGAVPNDWYCDACQLTRILEKESPVCPDQVGSDGAQTDVLDKNFSMHKVMEFHLNEISKGRNDVGKTVAFKMFLAKWIDEIVKEGKPAANGKNAQKLPHSTQKVVSHILDAWDGIEDSSNGNAHFGVSESLKGQFELTEEGNIRTVLFLRANASSLVISFRNQIGLILKVMSDKTAANLRKLSLRVIEKIVEADPKVMLMQMVKKAVSERFSDEAISVREAVVSLVGSYVAQSPSVANAFHSSFLSRLMDPGVSVRKRTVRILQDVLCSNPNYKGKYAACNQLLQRAADPKEDDGVRDEIHSLFLKLWLEEGDISVANHNAIGIVDQYDTHTPRNATTDPYNNQACNVGVVTPTPPDCVRSSRIEAELTQLQLRSQCAAEQMAEVVKIADTEEHLKIFLKELLCETSDVDSGRKVEERRKRQRVAQKHCAQLVDALFELLLSTEERRTEIGSTVGKKIIAIMRTIGIFAEVSPVPVFRHLDTVLPYLKADNGFSNVDESAIVTAASDILFRLASILHRNDLERLSAGTVGDDLVRITYSFGSTTIFSAVRAIAALAHHQDSGEEHAFGILMMKLCRTFYLCLMKRVQADPASLSVKVMNNVQRALCTLGHVCRHHETPIEGSLWDEEVENDEVTLIVSSNLGWSNLTVACYRLFAKYLEKEHDGIKCSALRAIAGIFGAHPRLMLAMEQSGLISDVMSDEAHMNLQLEALRCWKDILLAEEIRVESGDAKAKMDSREDVTTSKRIAGDQDSDATLVGGVLAKHSPRLFELTQSRHQIIRYAALDLIGQLLRQGMLNPNEAVPYLFALQGDVDDVTVRSLALKYLKLEGDKRPDMLRQRVCAGVKQSCKFQRLLYPKKKTSALVEVDKGSHVEVECVFDSVFRECVANNQRQREGLYRNLLGLFEKTESTVRKPRKNKTNPANSTAGNVPVASFDLPLLSYASQILAHLPYTKPGDPLYIIYHINSIVALQAFQLLDLFASFLRPFDLSSSDVYDECNEEEDLLERMANCKDPESSEEAEFLLTKNFDWLQFCHLCREASSLALLLRLKQYLRKAYHLSESRCLEYNPDSKERIIRPLHKSDKLKPFNSSLLITSDKDSNICDQVSTVRQYAEFRRLMRAEANAEAALSGSDDDEIRTDRKRGISAIQDE